MYNEDQPVVARWARESVANFIDVFAMVLLSINSDWRDVAAQMTSVRALGLESPRLFGVKRSAYRIFVTQAEYLKREMEQNARWGNHEDNLDLLTDLPGIGLPKAGFICQLLYGTVGCFDRHNLKRLGLDERAFSFAKAQTQAQRRKVIERYIETCKGFGGSEALWNGWCTHMATLYPKRYASAEVVSKMHVTHLGIERHEAFQEYETYPEWIATMNAIVNESRQE